MVWQFKVLVLQSLARLFKLIFAKFSKCKNHGFLQSFTIGSLLMLLLVCCANSTGLSVPQAVHQGQTSSLSPLANNLLNENAHKKYHTCSIVFVLSW